MTKLTTSGEVQPYALFDRELSGGDAPEDTMAKPTKTGRHGNVVDARAPRSGLSCRR
ncbi:hypothetical protein BRAS3843_520265 [Bradyrhizobium sp. STM 3843]|nr:hypothetical protein BRAS3843_520265 [Bradyrhizobium sp. STM 3843]